MRISDWSSDVCSSDLYAARSHLVAGTARWHGFLLSSQRQQRPPRIDHHRSRRLGRARLRAVVAAGERVRRRARFAEAGYIGAAPSARRRSEEHTSELQSLMRISYAVFCLKKKNVDYR